MSLMQTVMVGHCFLPFSPFLSLSPIYFLWFYYVVLFLVLLSSVDLRIVCLNITLTFVIGGFISWFGARSPQNDFRSMLWHQALLIPVFPLHTRMQPIIQSLIFIDLQVYMSEMRWGEIRRVRQVHSPTKEYTFLFFKKVTLTDRSTIKRHTPLPTCWAYPHNSYQQINIPKSPV